MARLMLLSLPARKAHLRSLTRALLLVLLLPGLLINTGCTRRYFRKDADKEVGDLLTHKQDPRWCLDGYHVYPDLRARFADPTNPDRPPMPPDDPAAHALSPNPQKPGHAGVGSVQGVGYLELLVKWDAQNRAELEAERKRAQEEDDEEGPTTTEEETPTEGTAAPPAEKSISEAEAQARRDVADIVTTSRALPPEEVEKAISKEKPFLIKLDQAVELGLINSREYQTRREQLYLAALPVTLERFAFAPQFFAVETLIRERAGRETPGGFANRWTSDGLFGFSRLFSTGALLLVSFANRTVYNLGREPSVSVSTISADLIQPFLRGGGRAVTLEPLTQAERQLLYAIRDFAKFRQEFYVYIASGQAAFIPGVQAGVQALTPGTVNIPLGVGLGALPIPFPIGAFPRPGVQVPPGPFQGRLGTVFGPTAPPQGFLSNLTNKAQLVNQYRNIEALRRYLRLFQVYLEGGIVNAVQVGQVEQQLLRSIDGILFTQASYRNSVDQFKLQLGLPMNVPLEVEDTPLRPMYDQTRRYEDISTTFESTANQALQFSRPDGEVALRKQLRNLFTNSSFVRKTTFRERAIKHWREWERLSGTPPRPGEKDELDVALDKLRAERRRLLDRRAELSEKGGLPKGEERDLETLDFRLELGRLERALRDYERQPWKEQKNPQVAQALQGNLFLRVYRNFLAVLEDAFRERQAQVRDMWPALPQVCLEGVDLLSEPDDKVMTAITRVALDNRLDLMNQRAQLVDAWRKIAVAANALLGTFNVEYNLNANTPLNVRQPLNFGGSRTRHQLILDGELPLVRIQERNNYRATLIAYQQQRRQLQLAEDQVLFSVRLDLRQLRAAALDYHTVQKRSVELAYLQVDQALQAFSQPQAPAGPALPAGIVGPPTAGGVAGDPAALTQQLLNAQNSLLNAQNDLYNTWIAYLTTRMALYRDLGVMPVDSRGVWVEDATKCCPPEREEADKKTEGDGEQLPAPRKADDAAKPVTPPRTASEMP